MSMECLYDYAEEVAEKESQDKVVFKVYTPKFATYDGILLREHPGKICEPTSLSYVDLPDFSPQVYLDQEVLADGTITALQFETIAYATRAFEIWLGDEIRCGFLCGDGPGVGKSRIISGLICHCSAASKKSTVKTSGKALWLTLSADLYDDIRDELRKLDASIICESFQKIKKDQYPSLEKTDCDVLVATYQSLTKQYDRICSYLVDKTYDGLIILDECHAAKNSDITQIGKLVVKLQAEFPRARVFYSSATMASDISHLGYMSRLGLWGTGTCFANKKNFMEIVPTSGVSAIELVAVDLKRRGVYVSRQISFEDVGYSIVNIDRDPAFENLYDKCAILWRHLIQYADSITKPAGRNLAGEKKKLSVEEQLEEKLKEKTRGSIFSDIWSSNQRFFLGLITSSKVLEAVNIAKREKTKNKSIVIGLQLTGEASLLHVHKSCEQYTALSVAREILERMLSKYFGFTKAELNRIPSKDAESSDEDQAPIRMKIKASPKTSLPVARAPSPSSSSSGSESRSGSGSSCGGSDSSSGGSDSSSGGSDDEKDMEIDQGPGTSKRMKLNVEKLKHNPKELKKLKKTVVPLLQIILPKLPQNPIDVLVEKLGGRKHVAELTGRVSAMEYDKRHGVYTLHRRRKNTNDDTNITERHRFMFKDENGFMKRIAIISDVASTGISLHAAHDCDNQYPRVHITLELPWSPEKAIQQFGRTNRTNQVEPPEYVTLKSAVPGEHRIISAVVHRLAMMGAITKGDHKATDSAISQEVDFEQSYGNKGLKLMEKLIKEDSLGELFEDDYGSSSSHTQTPPSNVIRQLMEEAFLFENGKFANKCDQVEKFLNRVMAMELEKQDTIMNVFMRAVERAISIDKENDLYDTGIRDFTLKEMGKIRRDAGGITWHAELNGNPDRIIDIHTITTDRGRKWGTVNAYYSANGIAHGTECLISTGLRNTAIVMFVPDKAKSNQYQIVGTLYSPSFYKMQMVNYAKLDGFRVATDYQECMRLWRRQYELMDFQADHTDPDGGRFIKCIHEFLDGFCPHQSCTIHARIRQHHILTGSVTELWQHLKQIEQPIQSMRLEMKDGSVLVGVKISSHNVEDCKSFIAQLN